MDKNNKYDRDLSITYDASIRYLVNKSNKRAWLVAFISIFLCFLSILAVLLLTPLKSVQPYVIRVNDTTGMVDIITTLKNQKITQTEAVNKFFVSTYVTSRESYYYDILQQDYIKTQLYSSPAVSEQYRALYSGKNSRVEVLKNKFKIAVDINSIVLGNSAGVDTATVRFTELKTDLFSKVTTKVAKIATLTYEYSLNDMTEEQRLKNPLGFKVLTYRLDYEVLDNPINKNTENNNENGDK